MKKHLDIKDQLYKLIENSEDEHLLKMVYAILNDQMKAQDNPIQLTASQEKELLQAYNESLDESNLLELEELKEKNSKWLEK
ncbi:MAG: hypothetical protein RIC80_15455 [Cyclobacteriaceae bacterium]